MRNMKISSKLLISFTIVGALSIIIALVGILGMWQINSADNKLYNNNLMAIENIMKMKDNFSNQRVYIRNIALYESDTDTYKSTVQTLQALETQMQELFPLYEKTIIANADVERNNFHQFKNLYDNSFSNIKKDLIAAGERGDLAGVRTIIDTAAGDMTAMNDYIIANIELNENEAMEAVKNNAAIFFSATILEIVTLLISIVIALVLARYISSIISKPMGRMRDYMEQVGKTGDLEIEPALKEALERDSKYTDEISQSIVSFQNLIGHITTMTHGLETISNKDLSINISPLSSRDLLGNSLLRMSNTLNDMFSNIDTSTKQVATGSVQIADASQMLAQGATEQAATVQQLGASINDISLQTQRNVDMTKSANTMGEKIRQSAEQGSQEMEQMITAVREINNASEEIGKVIKIIDDIAFQTNILALNAAVEAARAGQHGRGFAVVADEVRNLAAKSAEAAKNTGELIVTSMQKAQLGASISEKTSQSLRQIVEGVVDISHLNSDIATSSNDQALSISQISQAIDQVSQVVQQNSATAEESAASSQEMSSQAAILQQLVSQFNLKGGSSFRPQPETRGMSSQSQSFSPSLTFQTGFSIDESEKY